MVLARTCWKHLCQLDQRQAGQGNNTAKTKVLNEISAILFNVLFLCIGIDGQSSRLYRTLAVLFVGSVSQSRASWRLNLAPAHLFSSICQASDPLKAMRHSGCPSARLESVLSTDLLLTLAMTASQLVWSLSGVSRLLTVLSSNLLGFSSCCP